MDSVLAMKCPCSSGKEFAECCEPILTQAKKAATAEELMRSRYTAYATGNAVSYTHLTLPTIYSV